MLITCFQQKGYESKAFYLTNLANNYVIEFSLIIITLRRLIDKVCEIHVSSLLSLVFHFYSRHQVAGGFQQIINIFMILRKSVGIVRGVHDTR